MMRLLRKLYRTSRRAGRIWRMQGSRGLYDAVRRQCTRTRSSRPVTGYPIPHAPGLDRATPGPDAWRHASYPRQQTIRPQPTKRVLVVDSVLPTPDRDSGSLRMVNLLAILQEQGFAVTFAAMGLEAREPYLSALQGQGIECLHRPQEEAVEEHLRAHGTRYDLILLSRVETAAELLRPARRFCPRARVLFDTVDLHYLRHAREAALLQDARKARLAERIKREELDLVGKADATLVVSEVEKALLADAVPTAQVAVVSNIHRVHPSPRPFEERADILFIGGFRHPPNTDAVLYLCRDVWPRVQEQAPGLRLDVIGSDPPPEVVRCGGDRVRILGHVPEIDPYLEGCRLSVAPLRFGAGVKGKINQSLAHGLPVVATPVAAEGMFLVDGESALIAADAPGLAAAIVRLNGDATLWNRLARGGLAVIEEHFGFASARKALTCLLAQ